MNTQQVYLGARAAHVRELKSEVSRLTAELEAARTENALLRKNFALAMDAARWADEVPEGGRLVVVDGWNAILGSVRAVPPEALRLPNPQKVEALESVLSAMLAASPLDRCWLVLDGSTPSCSVSGRLRTTYTGGTGAHRADSFICDFLRARAISARALPVLVITSDKDFSRKAASLGAEVRGVEFLSASST